MHILEQFILRCREIERPRVLELGTKRSQPDRSTRHEVWVPHAAEFIGTDIEAGVDVDVVADVHRLSDAAGRERFDVIISCSTFEHFKYPHLAAHEILRCMRVGGVLLVQTHQSFPLHAYPYDFFRFSREALAALFGTKMGFRTITTAYEFPARIHSKDDRGTKRGEAHLNVCLFGEKTAATPEEYVYEL
jgi:SAM-dependent methyltransferase